MTGADKKITTKEFNALPLGEKGVMLWDKAKFIEVWHAERHSKTDIYLLDDNLVSVYYIDGDISKIIMWSSMFSKKRVWKFRTLLKMLSFLFPKTSRLSEAQSN